jgi:beta-N-acetylhexosaminidase
MSLRSTLIAYELRALGIDANCAPVADIASADTHPFLHNRCYGTDVQTVIPIARAVAEAHLVAGLLPVVKHIPGHGRSRADTHHDLPRVTTTLDDLIAHDFAPFRALKDLPMAMTAHIVYDAVDAENPATQSPAAIAMIRDQIGFDGLLITDDLNMQALSGDMSARVSRSLQAGCDLALQCNGDPTDMLAVAAAAPQMTSAAQIRAKAALGCRRPAPELDIAALAAEFSAIMGAYLDE